MTIASPMTLTLIQGQKCVSSLKSEAMILYIATWHDGRLMRGIWYAHARFDDLELDFDFENVYIK